MPLLASNRWGSGLTLDTGEEDNRPGPTRNVVRFGYFATVGAPLVAGREFTRADVDAGRRVAVVNESFVRRYFGGTPRDALGRRIGPGSLRPIADYTIIGVARDGKIAEVRETAEPFWWAPYQQSGRLGETETVLRARLSVFSLIVRTIRQSRSGRRLGARDDCRTRQARHGLGHEDHDRADLRAADLRAPARRPRRHLRDRRSLPGSARPVRRHIL